MGDNKSSSKSNQKTERFHKKEIKHDPEAESARAKFGKRKGKNED